MNAPIPSAAARTLVARSRRPARATAAAAVLRLAGGTALGPSAADPVSATAPVAAGAAPPAAPRPPLAYPAAAAATSADPAPAGSERPIPAPADLGQPESHPAVRAAGPTRLEGPARTDAPRAGGRTAGSAPPWPQSASASPAATAAAPPSPAGTPAGPQAVMSGVPGHGAARIPSPVPLAAPAILARTSAPEHEVLSRVTAAIPLVERARRPAPQASAPDPGAVRPMFSPPADRVTVTPQPPGRAPVVPEPPAVRERAPAGTESPAGAGSPAGPRTVPAHPPVTIGEIHVHVAGPAPSAPDPLALLAPYARGLTARRDGVR